MGVERNFKLLSPVLAEVYGNPAVWCPHCMQLHQFPMTGDPKVDTWGWNGNTHRPTFKPSMLIYVDRPNEKNPKLKPKRSTVCHFHVIDGVIHFCKDTPNGWAGKKMPLPAVPHDA